MKAVSTRSGEKNRVGNALRRILVVVEARSAECQIEVGHHGIQGKITCDCPGDVMGHSGSPHAALGADDRDDTSDSLGFRNRRTGRR